MHNFYYNKNVPGQKDNVTLFKRHIVQAHPDLNFFFPNYREAPWHVQAIVRAVTLNFWPHKLKGGFEMAPSVEGVTALQQLIEEARFRDDFDVIYDDTSLYD